MNTASPRFSNALVTALALILTYVLAFYWNLERPYWAGFTVFMVSLPTIGQSLLKGLLRILGTFLGAGVALLLYGLLHQNRFWLLLALSLYLCLCVRLSQNNRAYGYFYFMSSVVTAIIVLMAVQGADTIFTWPCIVPRKPYWASLCTRYAAHFFREGSLFRICRRRQKACGSGTGLFWP